MSRPHKLDNICIRIRYRYIIEQTMYSERISITRLEVFHDYILFYLNDKTIWFFFEISSIIIHSLLLSIILNRIKYSIADCGIIKILKVRIGIYCYMTNRQFKTYRWFIITYNISMYVVYFGHTNSFQCSQICIYIYMSFTFE